MEPRDLKHKKGFLSLPHTRRGGQVSLVMIFVLIVALVLYALSINWRTTANSKWKTINAATIGAAQIASSYGSYAYMLSQTYLKGKLKYKKCTTNVALVIMTVLTLGAAYAIEQLGRVGEYINMGNLIFGTASYSFNQSARAIVQQWNASQRSTGDAAGDFFENGSVTALQMAVDDNETVCDLSDADEDGNFTEKNGCNNNNKARVARATAYMDRRVTEYVRPIVSGFDVFQQKVANLLEELGISAYKSTCEACDKNPEKCNFCCVSSSARPASCSAADIANCLSGDPDAYDPFYCARQDLAHNFVGFWGQPDRNNTTMKTIANDPASPVEVDLAKVVRGADTEGAIFPLMSLLKDSAVGVSGLTIGTGGVTATSSACLWCGKDGVGSCQPPADRSFWGSFQQIELPGCEGNACCVGSFANDTHGNLDASVIDRVSRGPDMTVDHVSWEVDVQWTSQTQADGSVRKTYTTQVDNEAPKVSFYESVPGILEEEATKMLPLLKVEDAVALPKRFETDVPEMIARMRILVANMEKVAGQVNVNDTMNDPLGRWLASESYKQPDTWCVADTDIGISSSEQAAITAGGAGWGTIQSVVNCLNYNGNNRNAFEACRLDCANKCVDLPRSLVEGFDPNTSINCAEGSDYLKNIEMSAFLAKDQSVKFQQRGLYLKRVVDGVVQMRNAFRAKTVRLKKLTDEVEMAYQTFINEVDAAQEAIMEDAPVIYGWMGSSPAGKSRGMWHIVGVSGKGGNAKALNPVPYIKAKTYKKGFKVCIEYKLKNYSGDVSMMVWRYDEDLKNMNKFFNGVLSGDADLGKRIYDACVAEKDKKLWCNGASLDECTPEQENTQWRPAFVGGAGGNCLKVLGEAQAQSVSSTVTLHYTMGKRDGNTEIEPVMTFQ